MEKKVLNQTPIRTAKNFNINNIELNDLEISENVQDFKNLEIMQESGKDEVKVVPNEYEKIEVKYGSGLEKQIEKNANKNIIININSKTNKDIKLVFEFDKNNLNLIENIKINVEKDTNCCIYIIYKQKDSSRCYHNGLIRVNCDLNSKAVVNIVNLMNDRSSNILSIDGILNQNAVLKYNIVDFGGKNSITNLYSNLVGENSNNIINCIYLGTEKELIDINYIAELYGKKTNVEIEVQGALKNEAVKHFKGTIDFKKGCKKAQGNENEACMLLSEKAKSLALPMLLCSEEEVERKSFFKQWKNR